MKNSESKTLTFLRRNAVYLILAFCILAIGLSLTLILTSRSKPVDQGKLPEEPSDNVEVPIDPDDKEDPVGNPVDPDDNEDPVINPGTPDDDETPVVDVISFIMPVENATKIQEYSDTMVFNSTLNRFTAHMAVDFFAEEGTSVYAVEDGTVESVTNGVLEGVTVTIDHGDGLKTVYNSLADPDEVYVGQKVTRGQKIGEVSVTNRQEYKDGAHLHFEVIEDGETINPSKYLTFDEK